MKINWKVRFKNPVFIAQIVMSVLMPVLAYMGLTVKDVTSWKVLGNIIVSALENPYVLGLVAISVWNTLNDPTTWGLSDSKQALTYTEPKRPKRKD